MINDWRDDLLKGKKPGFQSMPVLGNLRSGIKRLVRPSKNATEEERAAYEQDMKVYTGMVEKGASWDDIEKAIGKNVRGGSKLTPENQDYFTVREIDCRTNPENAKILHDLYADKDGKIRTIPVVFLSADWFENIPHGLECWSARERKFWSEYKRTRDAETGENGYCRICMEPVPLEKGKRLFGGRQSQERGPCRPEECKEYKNGTCKFKGYVQAVIPGTRGLGVWQIHSTSILSFLQMKSKLQLVGKATGRIQGLIDHATKKPIMYIRKVGDEEIHRFDVQQGEMKTAEQDLIYLEADIDFFSLMLAYEPQKVLERGNQAQALLAGNPIEEPAALPPAPEPERPVERPYTLKHEPPPTPVKEPPPPMTQTTAAGPEEFIPELEEFDDQGNRVDDDPGANLDENMEERSNPALESAVIRDHYKSEFGKCKDATAFRALSKEANQKIAEGKVLGDDKRELLAFAADTSARLRGEKAA